MAEAPYCVRKTPSGAPNDIDCCPRAIGRASQRLTRAARIRVRHTRVMTAPTIEIRRFLHCNYNCRDLEVLERFYVGLFDLRPLMRSTPGAVDKGNPFGLYQQTASEATFLYDHRGGRRANSVELVKWTEPATIGHPYPNAWDRGMQSVGFSHADLRAVVAQTPTLGGSVVHQTDEAVLLRDPEGVAVEVYREDGPSEARSIRIVCSDLERSVRWWESLGFTPATASVAVPGASLWTGDGEHELVEERPMVPTDDDSLQLVLTRWSGSVSSNAVYGAPYHEGLFRMATAVDDAQAAYDALAPSGVAVPGPHTFAMPGTPLTDGLKILFIRDPMGILVELVERPRGNFSRA